MQESRPAVNDEMPFLDHLEELRWRIIWSLAAVIVCVGLSFFVFTQIDVIGLLERPIVPLLKGHKLIYTHPGEAFSIVLIAAIAIVVQTRSPGVRNAPMITQTTIAWRRNLFRNCGVTSPSSASVTITIGSSKQMPNAMVMLIANPKYSCAEISGSSDGPPKPMSHSTASGSTTNHERLTPHANRNVAKKIIGMTSFFSC